jgi:hypothetical protein
VYLTLLCAFFIRFCFCCFIQTNNKEKKKFFLFFVLAKLYFSQSL